MQSHSIQTMSPIVELLLLCFTLQQLRTAAAYPSNTYCPRELAFATPPVAFQSNLQTLLSALISSAANQTTTGFSNELTAGTATRYPLYGIFLCRGDITSATCASCVSNATAELRSKCSGNQEAIIWHNLCMVKYSGASFVGDLDDTLRNLFMQIRTVDGNSNAFNTVLAAALNKVKEEAATGLGEKKFAMDEGRVDASLTVYVLGQCTPDLSATDCRRCLEECIGYLQYYCENRQGGWVLFGSCNLRYDTYRFYKSGSGDPPLLKRRGPGGSGEFDSDGQDDGESGSYDLVSLTRMKLPKEGVQSEQLQIECGVLVTIILLFGVFVLGSLRRRVHGSWPGFWILVFHSFIAILIPLLLGLMRSASLPHKSFPIWACYLVFAYGGFDTMTARNLTDNDNSTSYSLYTFSLLLGVVYVALEANKNEIDKSEIMISSLNLGIFIVLVCLSVWNVFDTMGALKAASKSKGLPEASKQTEHHMHHVFINRNSNEEEAIVDHDDDDAVSMRGYPYLVDGTEPSNNIVTTTQVWQCVDKLLPSPTDDGENKQLNMADNEAGARLKDICLSRALFNILLMRCAGYSLQESSRKKMRRFVEDGFLSINGDLRKMQERVFTIIEWELEFLSDFFYTKFYYHSTKRYAFRLRRPVGSAIFLWFSICQLRPETREKFLGPSIITFRGHSLEVGVARTAIILIAIVEAVQLCMLIFSNWTIVKLICLYARRLGTEKLLYRKGLQTAVIEVTILFTSFVKYYLSAGIDNCRLSSSMFIKPWKRKLGQYSLVESHDKVPMLHRMLLCFAPRVSQKESPAVALSLEVKGAIISSLTDYGFALSCGKASLARNGLADQLSSFCSIELEGDAYVVLLWHIATSVCEHHFSTQCDEHFRVATQLSNYCAYLVIFAPEFLSGLPYKTHTTVLDTIKCARQKLKGTKGIAGRCSELVELSGMDKQDESLFSRAAVLADHLRSIFLDDPNRGWRVMAEFWVELILYLAPTENATAHAEHLATGGEFITLLWALLTNAGITSRTHFLTTL